MSSTAPRSPSARLDLDTVLARPPIDPKDGQELGRSREGRSIRGHVVESTSADALSVSLIGGCHADEPVGPAMLDRLASHLAALRRTQPDHLLVRRFRWRIVPHVNPDGEARNARWTRTLGAARLWGREGHRQFDLPSYLRHVVREPPGDDVEFGFPRGVDDRDARPEALAVAAFLRAGSDAHGPYALHASFHGMAFAAGPWFLLDRAWIPHTAALRDELRAQEGDWTFHDIDRQGEKGFDRIDRGFTTRPDSNAMREHFLSLGDEAMASLFRPSSMEFVRSLGGDPLTVVSEMPLFLVPAEQYRGGDEGGHVDLIRPAAVQELHVLAASAARRQSASQEDETESVRAAARRLGVGAMSVDDQMRWQLRFLDAALRCVALRADSTAGGATA